MTSSKSADALEIKDDELEEYQIHDIREEIERFVFCLIMLTLVKEASGSSFLYIDFEPFCPVTHLEMTSTAAT